jgi:DNA-directed RNA polymerase III subunit RPC2
MIKDFEIFTQTFKQLRRKGLVSEFVSICFSFSHKCVYISSDGGRLCRPYIIVHKKKPKLTQKHIDELNLSKK